MDVGVPTWAINKKIVETLYVLLSTFVVYVAHLLVIKMGRWKNSIIIVHNTCSATTTTYCC